MPLNAALRKQLTQLVPYGFVVTRAWLMAKGITSHAIDNLVKSVQLRSLAHGVYARPDTVVIWQGLAGSVQRMGSQLIVGGLSALELHGLDHYLSLSEKKTIHLYGPDALPPWMNRVLPDITFERHGSQTLWGVLSPETQPGQDSITEIPWGDAGWPLAVSTPERAFLEVLSDVPERISFEHADQLMQGLATLSPRRLEKLLASCRNVKVRRLFFWFAERHDHSWLKKLDPNDYDMGSGKRMLIKGGKLDRKYQITVPKDMHG